MNYTNEQKRENENKNMYPYIYIYILNISQHISIWAFLKVLWQAAVIGVAVSLVRLSTKTVLAGL